MVLLLLHVLLLLWQVLPQPGLKRVTTAGVGVDFAASWAADPAGRLFQYQPRCCDDSLLDDQPRLFLLFLLAGGWSVETVAEVEQSLPSSLLQLYPPRWLQRRGLVLWWSAA